VFLTIITAAGLMRLIHGQIKVWMEGGAGEVKFAVLAPAALLFGLAVAILWEGVDVLVRGRTGDA
jgi:hypothetical protein